MNTQTFLIRCEYPDGDHIPTQEFVENIQEYFAANIMDGEKGRLVVKPIYQPKEENGTVLNPIEIKSNANCLTQERADEINKPKPKFKVDDKVILDPYPCVVTDVNWRDSLHGFVYTVRGIDFAKMVREEDLVLDERTVPNTNEIIHLIKNAWNNFKDRYDIPDDYHFVDKNGNEINISEIVFEKKKKEYPKTFLECCKVLGIAVRDLDILANMLDTTEIVYSKNLDRLLNSFRKLLICRDAYWKIAGEEMGLGKPWEPDYKKERYVISRYIDEIVKGYRQAGLIEHFILEFPTEEMRYAFKENFDTDIEICKELL